MRSGNARSVARALRAHVLQARTLIEHAL
jgi:hypothetical protein